MFTRTFQVGALRLKTLHDKSRNSQINIYFAKQYISNKTMEINSKLFARNSVHKYQQKNQFGIHHADFVFALTDVTFSANVSF